MILSKSYKEIMDKVQVDDAMRDRVLADVQKQTTRKTRFSLPKIMRITSLAVCLLLCIGIAGLYPWQRHAPIVVPQPVLPPIEQTAPAAPSLPQTEPASEHTKQNADTKAEVPPATTQQQQAAEQTTPPPAGSVQTSEEELQLMGAGAPEIKSFDSDEELSQYVGFDVRNLNNVPFWTKTVQYQAYGKELAQITYSNDRRSLVYRKSPGYDDNSGDYTHYPFIWETTRNRRNISLKGNGTLFHLAVWQKYGYSYSLRSSKGMSRKDFLKIILSNEE